MTSSGESVQNLNDPPGDGVSTLAEGLSVATELAVASGRVYVARADQLAVVDAGGNVSELAQAGSPRGLAADASLLVWAEVDKVRAFQLEAEVISTIDEVDDAPTDVALGASFVVYVTASGRIVRIPRQ